jgi:hypothetical protein
MAVIFVVFLFLVKYNDHVLDTRRTLLLGHETVRESLGIMFEADGEGGGALQGHGSGRLPS